MPPSPPTASRRTHTVERHGRTIDDPYAWLRDDDWQRVMREPDALQPDIRAHLEAENAWTEQALAPIAALREELAAELKARIKEDEAIAEADTLLLTVLNQLGVDYNAHVIEAILTHVVPALGWR